MSRVKVSTLSDEEVTLPRAARLPLSILPPELARQAVTPITVAPTAIDVEPAASARARRPLDLIAVAVAAFALAWTARGELTASSTAAGSPKPTVAMAALASKIVTDLPAPTAQCAPVTCGGMTAAGPAIPTVNVADLPVLGSHDRASSGGSTRATARHSEHGGNGPARSELLAALLQVGRAAAGCGERGGAVRVVVSFSNSGVARSIRVSGEDLPAPTRSCIIAAASRSRVPAFSGDPVTVGKTL